MNILYIHPSWHYLDIQGKIVDGIGTYSSMIIPELLDRGHEIYLIATKNSSVDHIKDKYPNLHFFPIELNDGTTDNYQFGLPVKEYFGVINNILKNYKIDVIYNNFQNNKLFKFLNGLASKVRVVHYSHDNPNGYNLNILRKYNKIHILHCGQCNLESWLCEGEPQPSIIGRNDLCSVLESETCDLDRPQRYDQVLLISRLYRPTKGILEWLQVAKTNPNITFYLFGSRCNIPQPGLKIKFDNVDYTADYFEDIVSQIIDTIPNVKWLNKEGNNRQEVIDFMRTYEGLMISLAPIEPGVTTGIEAKAFGIPMITMEFPNSNMKYHVRCNKHNSLSWAEPKLVGNEFKIYDNGVIVDGEKFTPKHIEAFQNMFSYLNKSENVFDRHKIRDSFPTIKEHIDVLESAFIN